ncbi:MAG: PAS domain-containing protein [Candidatus Lambdaproteobacteria bacterium]|nr:PAS domain-containing protein [Candidatus Lambdaproteobacteria bacterium]
MALPSLKIRRKRLAASLRPDQIPVRIVALVLLFLTIVGLIVFLLNYSGFRDWKGIDANLFVFAAVSVNVVMLTAVFYLLLRNLFKLAYERRQPLAAVGLKTKLIVAFVALSLPSIAFHLIASGFIVSQFERWSQGEYRQTLGNAKVITDALEQREERLLRLTAEGLLPYLPRRRAEYRMQDWLRGYSPRHEGGLYVYDRSQRIVAQWTSDISVTQAWTQPPPDYLGQEEGYYWVERPGDQVVRRLVLPLPDSPDQLRVEVFKRDAPPLAAALIGLDHKQRMTRFLGNNLVLMVLSVLGVLGLLVIFAATWIAFYLARGFATPVETLADATHRVSQGDLGYQVDRERLGPLRLDFDGLVRAFNRMSRQLREQRIQLVEATESLRASHHQLGERNRLVELLLENVDAGIVSLNPAGEITAINGAARDLMQLGADAVARQHYRAVLSREVVAMLDEVGAHLRGRPNRQETRNLTLSLNRKTTLVEATVLALDGREEAEGLVLLLKDVTALQRTQRAHAWREVARRVAHEIKNPLTPIQLSAQRIRRHFMNGGDRSPQVLDQCTQTIIDEVSSLKTMVNEFSQFAKLPESQPEPGDLNAVIRETARLYQNGLPEGIALALELDPAVPIIAIDADQMKRAFTNLIDNAAAAIRGQGTITLRTHYDPDTRRIHAQVLDDGVGVPDHIRGRLFEPYTSTKQGGTGLGLTIVNQIVSDHDGYIRYADRRPHGSVFTMEFRTR